MDEMKLPSRSALAIPSFLLVLLLMTGALLQLERPAPLGKHAALGVPLEETGFTPVFCERDSFADNLAASLGFAEVTVGHNDVLDARTLFVWVVDPALDAAQGAASLARKSAARMVAAHIVPDPCARDLFELVQVFVVDPLYTLRFGALILTSELPAATVPAVMALRLVDEGFTAVSTSEAGGADVRREAPLQACTWREAKQALVSGFDRLPGRKAFYLFRDDSGVNAWVQWEGAQPRLMPSDFLYGISTAGAALTCLDPAADTLWFIFVDPRGKPHTIGFVPGSALDSGDPQDLFRAFESLYP